jgi:predicted NodU family carbamoyl transferase
MEYLGLPSFDKENLTKLAQDFHGRIVDTKELANLLYHGAIIGVVRERQEVMSKVTCNSYTKLKQDFFKFGPRALGNRSILCYPNRADLKDKLNK